MASKRRLRRKQCTGKKKHETFQEARMFLRGPGMNVYKCRFCGKFHVGHVPRRIQKIKYKAKYGR
jgi:hypothetical protein